MAKCVPASFTPAQARQLARLLRPAAGGTIVAKGGAEQALLDRAVAAGLVARCDEGWKAWPEARSFLRRLFVADGETEFAAQHADRAAVVLPETGVKVSRNLDESPLSHLARLRGREGTAFLPAEAVAAGERLHADFTRGQMQPRVTASWEPRLSTRSKGSAGGQADLSDAALAARARFSRAVDAMGPELSGVALDVCCFYKGLETVERERQWPARSAKLMLRAALMTLARHYMPPPVRPKLRHWEANHDLSDRQGT